MTRDDIIRMAREVGLGDTGFRGDFIFFQPGADGLERFYQLAVAAERKECAELCRAEANGRSPLAFDALHECADLIMEGSEK